MAVSENPSNLRPLLLSALSVVALALFGWYLFAPSFEPEPGDEDEGGTKYWYCPQCGLEMTCPPEKVNEVTPCPKCVHDGVKFEVHNYSRANGEGPAKDTDPVVKFLFFLPATLVVLLFISTQMRSVRFAPSRGKNFIFSCPACEHPVRYQQPEVGTNGICPDCGEQFIYPDLDAPPRKSKRSETNDVASAWLAELKKNRKGRR